MIHHRCENGGHESFAWRQECRSKRTSKIWVRHFGIAGASKSSHLRVWYLNELQNKLPENVVYQQLHVSRSKYFKTSFWFLLRRCGRRAWLVLYRQCAKPPDLRSVFPVANPLQIRRAALPVLATFPAETSGVRGQLAAKPRGYWRFHPESGRKRRYLLLGVGPRQSDDDGSESFGGPRASYSMRSMRI